MTTQKPNRTLLINADNCFKLQIIENIIVEIYHFLYLVSIANTKKKGKMYRWRLSFKSIRRIFLHK